MISEIYQRKFEGAGIEVGIAETGKEVFNKIKKDHYDLILLDLVLPEMSGLDVLKELKQSGKYDPQIKVIIFSNLNEKNDQDKAFALGADGFIPKSQFNPSQLVEEVRRMLNEFHEHEVNEFIRSNGEEKSDENGRKKILLIEDEEIFCEMFGEKLARAGFKVSVEANGAAAVKKALSEDFDLIITDMVVHGMTGDEIIANLRQEEKTANVPIIVLSASYADEEFKKVEQLGVENYFVKTRITPSELEKKATEILAETNQ